METPKWNQFKSTNDLYTGLELVLWDRLYKSKKHKAYYLFAVLFSEAYYLENNLSMVREAVHNDTLELIAEKRHPDRKDDDNIDIYFLDEGKGQYFIVLVYNPLHWWSGRCVLLDIIPVKRNDYRMTQIFPEPVKPKLKIIPHKKPIPAEPGRGE